MPRIAVNGIQSEYLIEGDGPETIVMVNGLADDKESWGYQTPDFVAAGHRVVLFPHAEQVVPTVRTKPVTVEANLQPRPFPLAEAARRAGIKSP